jgi:cyclopropane-fatty-acyl-phospholipid synthase
MCLYGVIEHLPNYRDFARRAWDCLRAGGLLYIDASATKQKYAISSFARENIWPGTHTFLCVQDLVRELLYHGFDVLEVKNETRDYTLTIEHWARRFDAARDAIVSRWGERLWRTWRLYLWAGAHAFHTDGLQAYHVVARRSDNRGPRPGWFTRLANGAKAAL